jgi:hypothetical protein
MFGNSIKMNRAEKLNYLNLLDKEIKDDKTTLRFAENFEVQSSAEGDYYKPNADHTDLVYDVLKFKKLKFPNATATPEIGSTTTVAPPPSGAIDDGVSPIMQDVVVYLEEGKTRYMPWLHCKTDFRFRDYIQGEDRWQIEDGVFIRGLNLYSYYIIISLDDPYGALDTTRTYDIKAISQEGRVSNIAKIRFVQPPAV